jgi:hypothetical protein
MNLSEAIEKLSYDPRFSWVINDPQAYFNKHTLALGEQLKVLVDFPPWEYHPLELIIWSAEENGERRLTRPLTPMWPSR